MSSSDGLVVVFEGKRCRVQVFRRFFYPVKVKDEDVDVIVFSDTGWEREVTYKRAYDYGLDDPLKLVSIIRLAKALNVLQVNSPTNGVQNYKVTICRSNELIGPDSSKEEWIPFDPSRLRPIDERLKEAKKKARWKHRFKKS